MAPGEGVPAIANAEPGYFSDLPPGDTAGVLKLMRATMERIDSALPDMTERDTTVTDSAGAVPLRLSAWLEDGAPRKLLVTELRDSTEVSGQWAYWFLGGDVAVAMTADAYYAIDADRIILWTDESLVARTEVPVEERMDREIAILNEVRKRLAAFGIALP